ncbi:hypothetical protein BC831DRAFT_444537 [Entophlyctis helioformis]|nr:hypothetical protein BC831DRAFT_444537 [Entophlyctis helioformis]
MAGTTYALRAQLEHNIAVVARGVVCLRHMLDKPFALNGILRRCIDPAIQCPLPDPPDARGSGALHTLRAYLESKDKTGIVIWDNMIMLVVPGADRFFECLGTQAPFKPAKDIYWIVIPKAANSSLFSFASSPPAVAEQRSSRVALNASMLQFHMARFGLHNGSALELLSDKSYRIFMSENQLALKYELVKALDRIGATQKDDDFDVALMDSFDYFMLEVPNLWALKWSPVSFVCFGDQLDAPLGTGFFWQVLPLGGIVTFNADTLMSDSIADLAAATKVFLKLQPNWKMAVHPLVLKDLVEAARSHSEDTSVRAQRGLFILQEWLKAPGARIMTALEIAPEASMPGTRANDAFPNKIPTYQAVLFAMARFHATRMRQFRHFVVVSEQPSGLSDVQLQHVEWYTGTQWMERLPGWVAEMTQMANAG